MRKTSYGMALFALAGGVYVASPFLEAFHLLGETPESPPAASIVVSSSTVAAVDQSDTVLDVAYDVRPHHAVTVTIPST
jgi:hypothetical protein